MTEKIYWKRTRGAWIASYDKSRVDKFVLDSIPQQVIDLAGHLLRVDGRSVCIPFEEHPVVCNHFILAGSVMPFKKVIVKAGLQSNCHQNAIKLWKKDKTKYRFATGYGLTDEDQMWRKHSWICDDKGNIIETTLPRGKYFGIIGDDELMVFFAAMYEA